MVLKLCTLSNDISYLSKQVTQRAGIAHLRASWSSKYFNSPQVCKQPRKNCKYHSPHYRPMWVFLDAQRQEVIMFSVVQNGQN